MVKPGGSVRRLGPAVVDEVAARHRPPAPALAAPARTAWKRFRKDFADRYGEGREVPLVEALDEEIGIGFERSSDVGAEASPLLHGLPLAPPAAEPTRHLGARESLLFDKPDGGAGRAARRRSSSRAKDVERLSPYAGPDGGESLPLADAFQVMATWRPPRDEALDRRRLPAPPGRRRRALRARGCSAASAMPTPSSTGRSSAPAAEEAHRPDAIFAEIVHLPQGRIGNILSRPVLREHEIPFLGRSGAPRERQIPITDLTVTVAGTRIVLRSRRLGREVIPRLTSAHNYRRGSLGIYRFLCMLQNQGSQGGAVWSWGPLDSASVPAAGHRTAGWCWRAPPGDGRRRDQGAPASQGRRALRRPARLARAAPPPAPRLLADGDNELLVDFDNVLSVETFLD